MFFFLSLLDKNGNRYCFTAFVTFMKFRCNIYLVLCQVNLAYYRNKCEITYEKFNSDLNVNFNV